MGNILDQTKRTGKCVAQKSIDLLRVRHRYNLRLNQTLLKFFSSDFDKKNNHDPDRNKKIIPDQLQSGKYFPFSSRPTNQPTIIHHILSLK
jgi:hypothetical protein